jgi:hypothetical protein
MTTIFHITGGLGKHVLATSVINSYKQQYPEKDIIVSSAYPDVFFRNPSVNESLDLHRNQYFYKNYIQNKEVEIFAHEPYKQTSHILKKKHLSDTWCEMIGIKKTELPSLHISYRERESAQKIIEPIQDKPVLIFQPFGGTSQGQMPYSWARDIHPYWAQVIVDQLKTKYNIIHICNPYHPQLKDVMRIEDRLDNHIMFSLLELSQERLLIDSCLQHAAFALRKQSHVVWGITSPVLFGYDFHKNVLPASLKPEGHMNSYIFDYEIGGNIPECPYINYNELHSEESIWQLIKDF